MYIYTHACTLAASHLQSVDPSILVAPSAHIYIYIYPVGSRGGPNLERFMSCEGAPQFLEKRFLPQKEANEELRGSPGRLSRGSPKTGSRNGGLPRSHAKFRAPSQLMKRFSPQNGRFGGHFRNIFESPSAKSPGSVRAPSQLFAFRRKKQISPKSPFSSLGSAERTLFKNVPKKWRKQHLPFRRKNDIFA